MLGDAVRDVVDPVHVDDGVLRPLGCNDVAEDEGVRHLCDPCEQIAPTLAVEVMDGENGNHEVERALRQRILEPRDADVGPRQPFAGAGGHRLAAVDPRPAGTRVAREHPERGFARSDAELEHVSALGDGCDRLLQLVIARDLVDDLAVALRLPRHAPTIAFSR